MEQTNCTWEMYNLGGNSKSPKMENGIRKPRRLCRGDGTGTDIHFKTSSVRISQGNRGRLAPCIRREVRPAVEPRNPGVTLIVTWVHGSFNSFCFYFLTCKMEKVVCARGPSWIVLKFKEKVV